jgi:deoxyribodipyrimidine photolyase-like uncharacterized protein
MSRHSLRPLRHLVLVLGDQLDTDAAAFDGFDPAEDAVWMAEAAEESTHIPSSQMRTAFFLSAMRHFAAELRARGRPLHYTALDDPANRGSLAADAPDADTHPLSRSAHPLPPQLRHPRLRFQPRPPYRHRHPPMARHP